jgi:hypothetical protein
MLVIMHRLKGAADDVDLMHAELLELCGDELVNIISLVITNKDSLLAEFQVCHNVTYLIMIWYIILVLLGF